MKQKHNKKRNTAFLYETLNRELTICILEKDTERKQKVVKILREFFKKGSVLAEELNLYNTLSEIGGMSPHAADKLIQETRFLHTHLDRKSIFNEQTKLINKINKSLSKDMFSYFVPNYKDLATIYQIFNSPLGSKDRVLLEESLINSIQNNKQVVEEQSIEMDDVIYKTFVNKFNEQYGEKLGEEQRILLEKYIFSFADNGLEFKFFLNEEISRLKGALTESMNTKELTEDSDMRTKAKEVLDLLEGYKSKPIYESKDLMQLLKVQQLVKEINE